MKIPSLALLAVLASLAVGCGGAEDPAPAEPTWTDLARGFSPATLPKQGVSLPWSGGPVTLLPGDKPGEVRCRVAIPNSRWRDDGGGIWSAPLPVPAWMPAPESASERGRGPTLQLNSASVPAITGRDLHRIQEGNLVRDLADNLSFLRSGGSSRFGLFAGRVHLATAEAIQGPGDAELTYPLVLGESEEGRWRVLFDELAADGIHLVPGHPVEISVDVPAGSALRFALVCVGGGSETPKPARVTLEIDGAPAGSFNVDVAAKPVPRHHVVPLPAAGLIGATLSLSASPTAGVVALLNPVIGPLDIGDSAARPWRKRHPDIVMVIGDTYRADNLEDWGGDPSIAPHLNRFAASCRRYLAARAPATSTLPSHAALFTGRYPPQCGVHTGERMLASSATTLAEHLREAGYRTAAVTDAGFVSWQYGLAQGFMSFEQSWTTDFEETLRATERLIDADDGRPLFLFVHSYRAHNPYLASAESRERLGDSYPLDGVHWDELIGPIIEFRRSETRGAPLADRDQILARFEDLYRVASSDFDAGFGELLSLLERNDLTRDSILVFTSDHGEAFGEHGVIGHGRSVWEEEARIPLLLRAPGLGSGSEARDVSLVDLAPTLASLAGLDTLPGWIGSDLTGELQPSEPTFAFTGSWVEDLVEVAAIEGGRKLILDARDGPGSIRHAYVLTDDPLELEDRAGEDWAEAMRLRLEEALARSLENGAHGDRARVSPALRRRLDALGYGGSGSEGR